MTDSYPEYLNPFAEDFKPKSKVSLSHSFKELKRSLRQSFRIKKKENEEVTLRQKTDTLRRVPVSYPTPPQQLALPRSRFRERLSKCEPSTSTPGPNPFEEEKKEVKVGTTRRRGKKRAPLPPKSLSSQDVNDDNLQNRGSRWSLTSNETDYSESTDNVSRNDLETDASRESLVDKFADFNKEMEKLKDDSNNNVITKEEIAKDTESNSNIPDLVISCPSDTDSTKLTTDENVEEVTHPPQNITNDEQSNTNNSDTLDEKGSKDAAVTPLQNISNEDQNNSETAEERNSEGTVVTPLQNIITDENENKSNTFEESDGKDIVVTDITNNMIVDENNIVSVTEEEGFLYHEKKSLYIAGSRDELNENNVYTGRVSLFITGSSDDLDKCNNNDCTKHEIDENSNDDASLPIPKQRKNKLSKNILLGM